MNRRDLLLATGAGALLLALNPISRVLAAARPAGKFEVSFDEAEWKRRLTPAQFAVLRQAATERPFTSPLLNEKRRGTYSCAPNQHRDHAAPPEKPPARRRVCPVFRNIAE